MLSCNRKPQAASRKPQAASRKPQAAGRTPQEAPSPASGKLRGLTPRMPRKTPNDANDEPRPAARPSADPGAGVTRAELERQLAEHRRTQEALAQRTAEL